MKKLSHHYSSIFIVIILMTTSCGNGKKKAYTYLENSQWNEITKCAREENKGIILAIGSEGCVLCSSLFEDMEKDKDMQTSIGYKYIYARLDQNIKGNEWITLTTATTRFPSYLVFDKRMKLCGLFSGYESKELFFSRINEINNGNIQGKQELFFHPLSLKEMAKVSPEDLLAATQKNIEAYQYWADYNVTKDSTILNKCIALLQKSVELFPDIFNQYLLAECYVQKKDYAKGVQLAERSLVLAGSNVRPLYVNMRTRIKKIVNRDYDEFDDPYMKFDKQNISIGTLVFGQKRLYL